MPAHQESSCNALMRNFGYELEPSRDPIQSLALGPANPLLVLAAPKLSEYPKEHTADGFVLWTRVAPKPLDPASMPAANVPVQWHTKRTSVSQLD